MQNNNSIITLFSSDSTVQYVKDIFSVLSLPRESIFEFRYQERHVEPNAKTVFENSKKGAGTRALISFRSNNATDETNRFYVPIRWAEILKVTQSSDVYTVRFKLAGYPTFTHEFQNNCHSFTALNTTAKQHFNQNRYNEYAVANILLPNVDTRECSKDRDSHNWRDIVHKLTLIEEYKNYHFFKCSAIYYEKFDDTSTARTMNECAQVDHRTRLVEGSCANIDIEYYSETYDKNKKRHIEVFIDSKILSKAKGLRTELNSRYGTIRLGFQPQKVTNNTITEIVIYTACNLDDEISTEVLFPVVIVKDKVYKQKKAVIMMLGALLIALPGIIGSTIHTGWNISFAVAGAIIMGINHYWESKE